MTRSDVPSARDRGDVQPSNDPQGGASGTGQMKPHTQPERTDPQTSTTLQDREDLGPKNGPSYQTGGARQDRADEVEERKQDGRG